MGAEHGLNGKTALQDRNDTGLFDLLAGCSNLIYHIH